GPYRAGDRVAATQPVLAHLRHGDVDILGPGEVAVGADEGVVVEYVHDPGHRHEHVVVADLRFAVAAAFAAAPPVPVAVAPAAPATAAALVVLVAPVPAVTALGPPGGAAVVRLAGAAFVIAAAGGAFLFSALRLLAARLLAGLLASGLRRPRRTGRPPRRRLLGRSRAVRGGRRFRGRRGRVSLDGPGTGLAGGDIAAVRASVAVGDAYGGTGRRGPRVCGAGRRHLGAYLFPGFAGGDRASRPWLVGGGGGVTGASLAGLPLLNGGDQIALTHSAGARDAKRPREALQLRQQHRPQPGAAPATGGCVACGVGDVRPDVGGVAQWIPSLGGPGATRAECSGRSPMTPARLAGVGGTTATLVETVVVRRALVGVGRTARRHISGCPADIAGAGPQIAPLRGCAA